MSGPLINWKKHWKGWHRTKEDLDAEQKAIEAVARSLCWKKIKEEDDIAIVLLYGSVATHGHSSSMKHMNMPSFMFLILFKIL